MSANIRPVRGMNDVLPPAAAIWQRVEDTVRRVVESYGYRQVRLPLLEFTELFQRSIGEVTDIVAKEMYTFEDRNGESLTLRPEATAGVVRAAISHGLIHNQKHKFWTSGPMFRYEKPQKGRYRQFHQMDVEALGFAGPDIDAEMILMSARIFSELGIERISLELNSLGTPESRQSYRAKLIEYFSRYEADLDADSKRRLEHNPMRILDSKNPAMRDLLDGAPEITENLDSESEAHFDSLRATLQSTGIDFNINTRLVRGLDYYSRTVFEWVTDALGAQGAVCSGGRYDGLVEHLGGSATPAIGWALGVERLVGLYEASAAPGAGDGPEVYVVAVGAAAEQSAVVLAEALRDDVAGLRIEVNHSGGSFKAQMKRADRSGAILALVIGENELASGEVGLKPLRSQADQITVDRSAAAATIESELRANAL